MTLAAATVPDWIEALSTLVLGLLGIAFGWVQFRASGFRPKVEALMGVGGDSLQIAIRNRGRAEGTIHGLDVVDASGARVPLTGAGATFASFPLAAGSAKVLTFNAPEDRDFGPTDTVVVSWGRHDKRVHPFPVAKSFYVSEREAGALVT